MNRWCEVALVVICVAFWCHLREVSTTSPIQLQSVLKHPHYADKHQHSYLNYQQQKKSLEGRPPHPSSGSWRSREKEDSLWGRPPPQDASLKSMPMKHPPSSKNLLVADARTISQELADVKAANEHFVRMRLDARCRVPRPEVVCVRDMHPDKEFLPRCTVLHRCSEMSGCCEEDHTRCSPRAMQEVVLNFYVLGADHRSSDVQKLLFVNHTECECQSKPTSPTTTSQTTISPTSTPGIEENVIVDHFPQRDQKYPKACRRCPSPFSVREWEDGRCSCDCFDRHRPCIRVKRGREPLQDYDRRCVLSGRCGNPDCDYGAYEPDSGRCPKKSEHQDTSFRRPAIPDHRNPNHRWNYFERD